MSAAKDRHAALLAQIVPLLLTAACRSEGSPPPPAASVDTPVAAASGATQGEDAGGARAAAGRALYEARCALCHERGQGPDLDGVIGRSAGGARAFGYTRALRSLGITWDVKSLDAFLAAPDKLAPGTTMLVAVPDAAERADLIAFLATTEAPPGVAEPKPVASVMPEPAPARALAGRGSFGGYRDDGPGVRRHITAANLPAPLASPSSRNPPLIVLAPSAASLHVPPGFAVSPFLENLVGPRLLRVAPNGDIFVAESSAGRIRALRAKDGAPHPDENEAFATGLDRPFGLAFYPPGEHPKWLYVADNDAVVRFPYRPGDLHGALPRPRWSCRSSPARQAATGRGISRSPATARRCSCPSARRRTSPRSMPASHGFGGRRLGEAHGLGAAWGDEENARGRPGLRSAGRPPARSSRAASAIAWACHGAEDRRALVLHQRARRPRRRPRAGLHHPRHKPARSMGGPGTTSAPTRILDATRRAPRPRREGGNARRAAPAALGLARAVVLRRGHVPRGDARRRLRRAPRLVEPRNADRLQGGPRAS